MEGEFFDRQDVIAAEPRFGKGTQSAWMESLKRIARAQAILWNESPITTRQAILARIDREAEREQK